MKTNFFDSKHRRIVALCFVFLLTVAIISFFDIRFSKSALYVLVCGITPCVIVGWGKRKFWFFTLCLGVIFFATLRYTLFFQSTPKTLPPQVEHFSGIIIAEPDIRADRVNYIAQTEEYGRVYIKYDLYPRFEYGDKLSIKCKLKKPEPIEDFAYDKYLARFQVFAFCQQPNLDYISRGHGRWLLQGIFSLKKLFATQVNLLWHEPYAGFMAGLLYGYRGGLGSLNELFAITGVTHIIAISGYNISLISSIFLSLFLFIHIPKKLSFWLIGICIGLFVLFAGASASVVRAGIMGAIVLFAQWQGRGSAVFPVMLYTATIMTAHNPMVLLYDAGFQLSFLATLGLVYLANPIEKKLLWVPEFLVLRESLVATLAATISTLPLILFQFGRLSIVAVIVNMLVLWILPITMALGFFAVVLSWIFTPAAQVLAWCAFAAMEYVVLIVRFFAAVPHAAVDVSFPWWGMIGGYGIIGFLCYRQFRTYDTL